MIRRNAVCAAGFGHQPAEHGAQAKHDADKPHHVAKAVLERLDNGLQGHAGHQTEHAGNHDQGDKGVNTEAGNQKNQYDNGKQCV